MRNDGTNNRAPVAATGGSSSLSTIGKGLGNNLSLAGSAAGAAAKQSPGVVASTMASPQGKLFLAGATLMIGGALGAVGAAGAIKGASAIAAGTVHATSLAQPASSPTVVHDDAAATQPAPPPEPLAPEVPKPAPGFLVWLADLIFGGRHA